MSGESYSTANGTEPGVRPRRGKRHKGWTVLVWVLFGAGVAFWLTAVIAVHRAVPILRDRVINTLATRFDSRVELAEFDVSLTHGVDVTGKGLKLFPHALVKMADRDEAAFAVGQFHFHTTPWALLRSPMHVGRVELTDLVIYRPTKEERARMRAEAETRAQEPKKRKIEVVVDEMTVDRARLTLGTDKPGKVPLLFEIHALVLSDVGRSSEMRFHATLVNPKPIGEIDSSGWFGPYVTEEPGESPVRGEYRFDRADLNTIKGIGGTLSSTGRYAGKLDGMAVDGVTHTPDFSLDTANHPMRLETKFHAVVDGLNGNTYLQPVEATLGGSHIVRGGR